MPKRNGLWALLIVGAIASVAGGYGKRNANQPDPTAPAAPTLAFEVGKETPIDDPAAFDKHHVLYVPKDYTPDREWPLIFCYHGVNQQAKVWPFKELTDGNGFIVVGMSYLEEKGADTDKEWASMQRVGKQVAATLKVNSKMIFIGGFSLGGGWTYRLSNKDPSMFAGIAALGMSGSAEPGKAGAFAGKPVIIAHGEKDEYCQTIQPSLDSYKRVGAELTHEVFKGLGHTVDTKNEVLKKWLADNGPLKAIRMDLEPARAMEKAGKLGQAYAAYQALAKVSGGGEYAKSAADSVKAIADAADKKFADAESAVSEKKYAEAVKTLVGLEKTYAGSELATKAKDRLSQIQSDPAIKSEIQQARIDAAADAMEAQAQAAERSKDFGRAFAIYEKYVTEYPKAKRFDDVTKHLAELKADKSLQSGIAGKQMEMDCKGWLSMADNYAKAGFKEKARPYLQKVIDKYPSTEYAAAAKRKLAELK